MDGTHRNSLYFPFSSRPFPLLSLGPSHLQKVYLAVYYAQNPSLSFMHFILKMPSYNPSFLRSQVEAPPEQLSKTVSK